MKTVDPDQLASSDQDLHVSKEGIGFWKNNELKQGAFIRWASPRENLLVVCEQ